MQRFRRCWFVSAKADVRNEQNTLGFRFYLRLVLHMFRAAGNFSQRKISYFQKLLILEHIKCGAWALACFLKE